jgi:GNAT superfamily N-acetyltransferase
MAAAEQWNRGAYRISTDKTHLDVAVIHQFLSRESYWAQGVPRDIVERSIANSLSFGVYEAESGGGAQVGFARVITDYATFAYLCDVFILSAHRGQGLSKWLMEVIVAHPDLQGLRRFLLFTRDAHSLYARYGFTPLHHPQNALYRHDFDPYRKNKETEKTHE